MARNNSNAEKSMTQRLRCSRDIAPAVGERKEREPRGSIKRIVINEGALAGNWRDLLPRRGGESGPPAGPFGATPKALIKRAAGSKWLIWKFASCTPRAPKPPRLQGVNSQPKGEEVTAGRRVGGRKVEGERCRGGYRS